ncbi:MAG: orotate phosphoribosyltransferase [Candidatus Zixiibacteriota bacterium]|nr:MAG: orotate phosphoribosyltransferase [candidate division Zixibacteria bacterium]
MTPDEILQMFRDSKALLTGHFKLTSGRHSDVYYEKFTLLKKPTICTEICREMAERFRSLGEVTVVGPTTGGIIIAYDVGRYLGMESIYAEPGDDGGRVFKRGFSLNKGQRVVIVDDILTTGRSIFEVIDLVRDYGAEITGVGVLLDRSGGSVEVDYPFHPLAMVSADSWEPADCPLCAKGVELTQRGSRKF